MTGERRFYEASRHAYIAQTLLLDLKCHICVALRLREIVQHVLDFSIILNINFPLVKNRELIDVVQNYYLSWFIHARCRRFILALEIVHAYI